MAPLNFFNHQMIWFFKFSLKNIFGKELTSCKTFCHFIKILWLICMKNLCFAIHIFCNRRQLSKFLLFCSNWNPLYWKASLLHQKKPFHDAILLLVLYILEYVMSLSLTRPNAEFVIIFIHPSWLKLSSFKVSSAKRVYNFCNQVKWQSVQFELGLAPDPGASNREASFQPGENVQRS